MRLVLWFVYFLLVLKQRISRARVADRVDVEVEVEAGVTPT